ncbi:MAG TPA: amidohydrolase family protein [Xanthomonadales bacterium]|nr:amidohydrolase family protein [Xanthomonadales bacterium]
MIRNGSNARNAWLLAAAVFASLEANAQALFINEATVHTLGPQGTLQRADVLVRDGRIKAVGAELPVPSDATLIEAGGRPLTPGFFAGISQLGLLEITLEESSVDGALAVTDLRPEFDVTSAYNPWSAAIPVTRIEGYTWTVLGAERAGSIVGGQGRAVALDDGYTSFLSQSVLFLDVGADASGQSAGTRAGQWMLLEQAMAESAIADGAAPGWAPAPVLTLAGRRAMQPFRNGGITVFDVDRASDMLQVLEFSTRHGLKPVISGGAEAWMIADRLAEAGVPVLIDALENLPDSFDQLGARLDNAAILHAAGVTLAFTGEDTHNARKLRQTAGNAVAHGLPYDAGLAAMTVNPALIFELPEGTGVLQIGSRADLVLWSDDPLDVTSVADQVVIAGQAIPMVSRQTLLRDRYLQASPGTPRAYIKP